MLWGSPVAEALSLGTPSLPPSDAHFPIYGNGVDSGCWLRRPSAHSLHQVTLDPSLLYSRPSLQVTLLHPKAYSKLST